MSDEKFFINNAKEIVPPVNDSPYRRVIAVGDVHGQFNALKSLLRKLNVTEEDFLVFVGDYVDRGHNVAEVLEWVMKISARKNFAFLRGNHEQMMLNALTDKGREFLKNLFTSNKKTLTYRDVLKHQETILWIQNGGDKTFDALTKLEESGKFTVDEVLNFARNLPLSYSITIGGRTYFFCHAGVEEGVPLDKQSEEILLWSRENFFNRYEGDDVIISGHSPIKLFFDFDTYNPRPIKIPGKNILMIDTGAFIPGGRLSAVDILSGQYWQSGADRQGDILFLCTGNTCRSPMAKYIMRDLLKETRLNGKVLVDSAGCKSDCGDFMSEGARKVLRDNGIDFSRHVSKTFTEREYRNYKSIIALDNNVLKKAVAISHGDPDKKIRLFKDFNGNDIIVENPFKTHNYSKAYTEIYDGCQVLCKELINNREGLL